MRSTEHIIRDLREGRERIRQTAPLIHCITHPIVINDCANAVLALGARPIMAEHPKEVAAISSMAQSLTVSLGNITDVRAQSILIAGKERSAVLDLVGITCSPFRMELAREFIRTCHPAVIKGNASEIRAIAGGVFHDAGIDVDRKDQVTKESPDSQLALARLMKKTALETGAVLVASGEVDLIVSPSEERFCCVENGSPRMARVTGTGCMMTCVIGTCLSVLPAFSASVIGAITMGAAGEAAEGANGLGTYHIRLIDALSLMTDDELAQAARIRMVSLK